jgi:hypothetical protein
MRQKDAPVEALRTANDLQNALTAQRQKRSWQTPEIQKAAFHITSNNPPGAGSDALKYNSLPG